MYIACRATVGVARTAAARQISRDVLVKMNRLFATSAANQGQQMYRGLELELRNKKMGRPLSPFLSSYKMHFPMATSLLHRVSGAVYSSIYYLSIIGVVSLAPSFPALIETIKALQIDPTLILGAKFIVSWPVIYHMFNGLRHLAWDAGKGFDLPMVYKSGFTVLTITTLVTLYLCTL